MYGVVLGGLQRLCNSYFSLTITGEFLDKILFFPYSLTDWPVHPVYPCIRYLSSHIRVGQQQIRSI